MGSDFLQSFVVLAQSVVNRLLVFGIFINFGNLLYWSYIKVAILGYLEPRRKNEAYHFMIFNIILCGISILLIHKFHFGIVVAVILSLNLLFEITYMCRNTADGSLYVIFFALNALLLAYGMTIAVIKGIAIIFFYGGIASLSYLGVTLVSYTIVCRGLVKLLTEGAGNIAYWLNGVMDSDKNVIQSIVTCLAILILDLLSFAYPEDNFDSAAIILYFLYIGWGAGRFKLLSPGSRSYLE